MNFINAGMGKKKKTCYCVSGPLALGLCVLYCFDLILGGGGGGGIREDEEEGGREGENTTLRYIGTAGKYKQTAGDHYALEWIRRQSLIEKKDGAADDGDCTDAPSVPIRPHLASRGRELGSAEPRCFVFFYVAHLSFAFTR